MPLHDFVCTKCAANDERYIRLARHDKEINSQVCDACGGHMRKVWNAPTLKGLDSGPSGFLAGRVEQDGCETPDMRRRLRRNAKRMGANIEGGVFVPGLCRKGIPEDPYAVVRSRAEVLEKARALDRCVEGPGMDMESPIRDEHLAAAEAPYMASAQVGIDRAIEKVRDSGRSMERKKFFELAKEEQLKASGNR